MAVTSSILSGKPEKVWTPFNQKQCLLQSRQLCPVGRAVPGGRPSSLKCAPDTSERELGWWAEDSSHERVMGDVRRAQSSTCSPWLSRNIQFPVCQRPDAPCISSVFTSSPQYSEEHQGSEMYEVKMLSKTPVSSFLNYAFHCIIKGWKAIALHVNMKQSIKVQRDFMQENELHLMGGIYPI